MLEQQGIYNDLSPKLRKEIEDKVQSFGKSVRFKFNISNPNPDPLKYNGETIYPFLWTLDPKTFQIKDPYEDRPGKQKVKRIGIINKIIQNSEGKETGISFKCVRVSERFKGVMFYDLDSLEQQEYVAYLLLHPKMAGGEFADKGMMPRFTLIDENKLATEQRGLRKAKLEAGNYAAKMSDKEVVEFADAMTWNSTEDISILRNKIEDMAEHTPDIFNDLVKNDRMKFQTVVKQALDNNIISYDPIGNRIVWVSTTQPIMQLSGDADKNEVERAAMWFQLGGEQATKAFEKIKSLMSKASKIS
jgi:hypothetical protein